MADIVRTHHSEFLTRWNHVLSREQRKALRDIRDCRSAALGGRVQQCDRCGHRVILYNSCRNRHCPKCQARLAPAGSHSAKRSFFPFPTFTSFSRCPRRSAAWRSRTPDRFTPFCSAPPQPRCSKPPADPRLLGASIGFLAVLHTWGQNLHLHPHLHCVVPGGGISLDGSRWIGCRKSSFFLPVRLLSHRFRESFLRALRRAFRKGALRFHGDLKPLSQPAAFEAVCEKAAAVNWVVHSKPPFGGPRRVLKYLARYTHRVAISNHRLRSLENGRVSFEWKDYADHARTKLMSLDAAEFLRRFLLHVLPTGLVRIRQFGWLANRVRKHKIELCRTLLAAHPPAAPSDNGSAEAEDPLPCPICKLGRLRVIEFIAAEPREFPDTS